MVTTSLIHPEIIAAPARCGHGSKILIADGNYPLAEKKRRGGEGLPWPAARFAHCDGRSE